MAPDLRPRGGDAQSKLHGDPKRRKGPLEREVIQKVKGMEGFWHALKTFSKSTGVPEEDLEGFAEELASACWSEADQVAGGSGALKAAREEVDKLKQKLHQCNLTAMKQIAAAKGGSHTEGLLGDDTITFHEPLQYIDEETKELVMSVVCEKVRLLEDGHAPPSLVEALIQHAATPKVVATADEELEEELETARFHLKGAQLELASTRIRAEDAEARAEQLKAQQVSLHREVEALRHSLVEAERLAEGFRRELAKAKEALSRADGRSGEGEAGEATGKAAEARRALEALKLGHEALQGEHKALQEVSTRQRAEIQRIGQALESERLTGGERPAEVERLQGQVQRARQELHQLQGRCKVLEEEASAMREELSRRGRSKAPAAAARSEDQERGRKDRREALSAGEAAAAAAGPEELEGSFADSVAQNDQPGPRGSLRRSGSERSTPRSGTAYGAGPEQEERPQERASRLLPPSWKPRGTSAEAAPSLERAQQPAARRPPVPQKLGREAGPGQPGGFADYVEAVQSSETLSAPPARSVKHVTSLPSLTTGAQQNPPVVTVGYGCQVGARGARLARRDFF